MERSRTRKSTPERLAHGRICGVRLIVETRIGSLESPSSERRGLKETVCH
jgi:hypothetical protein